VTAGASEAVFTLKALQDMLGVSRADVLGFIKAGFVTPTRGARNTYRFGFQDVVLLRTAQSLRDARISATRIRKSLQRLQQLLPAQMPLSGLRITALGDDIAVREHGQAVAVDTGQFLLDFEVTMTSGSVLAFPQAAAPPPSHEVMQTAQDALQRGADLFDARAFDDALAAYDEGLADAPTDPDLSFNRAIVLEELDRLEDAVTGYRHCLELDPGYADAHWNIARLYEKKGIRTLALRHFSAYRRLSR